MARKLAGIDEAGRGPVLGPLVVAAVVVDEDKLDMLKELGVRDSKKLSPKRREEIIKKALSIVDDYSVVELWPEEIDSREGTLNELEVETFARALNSLKVKPDVVYVDSADVREGRFGEEISSRLRFETEVVARHRADDLFLPVSLASILAKVRRDRAIERLKERYGEIGSGYPSDPRTRAFLENYYREHGEFPPIVRRTWKTLEKIAQSIERPRGEQLSLEKFLKGPATKVRKKGKEKEEI